MATPGLPPASSGGGAPRGTHVPGLPPGAGGGTYKKKKKKKALWGVPGFFENLAGDAEDMITGLGPAAYEIGSVMADRALHPKSRESRQRARELGKSTAEGIAYNYAPLARGDFGEFGHRLYEHPLGPILDVATVLSGGTSGTVKLASLMGKRGITIPKMLRPAPREFNYRTPRTEAAKAHKASEGNFGPNPYFVSRPVTGTELSRRMKIGSLNALGRLPLEMRVLGEYSRMAGLVRKRLDVGQASLLLKALPFHEVMKGLSKEEGRALALRAMYPSEGILKNYREILRTREAAGAKDLNPHFVKITENPKVMEHYRNPSQKMMDTEKVIDNLDAQWVKELGNRGTRMTQQLADFIRWEPSLVAMGAKYDPQTGMLMAPEGFTIDEMVSAIQKEVTSNGVSQPRYFPHVSELKNVRIPRASGGGMRPPRDPTEIRGGVLELAGRMVLEPEVWLQKYIENARFVHYDDTHRYLESIAVKGDLDDLPEGYVWITQKNENISPIQRTATSYGKYLDETLKEDPRAMLLTGTEKDLFTTDFKKANKQRLMVPENIAKKIVGDFKASQSVPGRILREVTTVWRALVLNLRVGWLVNNMVGNSFLYAIQNAGPTGLKAYLRAVASQSPNVLGRLLTDKATREILSVDDIIEIFPEQYIGTFFGTQIPVGGAAGKLSTGKIGKPTRALRRVDVAYERALRQAMLTKIAKKNPKIKQRLNNMPEETRNFNEAAMAEFKNNPKLVREVSAQVNDALGDFFSMSNFERNWIRAYFPFYAWYKAITKVLLKLPIDKPLRTNILAHLGQVGDEYAAEDYGLPYLKGAVDLPGGQILRTKQANPLATDIDIVRGFRGLLPGGKRSDLRNFTGMINPIVWSIPAAIANAERGNNFTDWGPIGEGGFSVFRDLPETRLMYPYKSKLYEDQGRWPEFLSYLGLPIRTPNEAEARKRAREGK